MLSFDTDEFRSWPGGVSNGLVLPCSGCGTKPRFDYNVDDAFWRQVVPDSQRLGVLCLPCLDALASAKGLWVHQHLRQVQFTGERATIVLVPAITFRHSKESL